MQPCFAAKETTDNQPQVETRLKLALQLLRLFALLLHIPLPLHQTGRTQQDHFVEPGDGDQRFALSLLQLRQQFTQQVRLRVL
ncbi:hypothetical protein D3C80_1708190 [compost metagenome]